MLEDILVRLIQAPSQPAHPQHHKRLSTKKIVFVVFPEVFSQKIACSCYERRDERVKKRLFGEKEKAFQANCGSFSYIVYQHAGCGV